MKTMLDYWHSKEFRDLVEGAGYELVEDVLCPPDNSALLALATRVVMVQSGAVDSQGVRQ